MLEPSSEECQCLSKNHSNIIILLISMIDHVTTMADWLYETIMSYMEHRRQYNAPDLAKVAGLSQAKDRRNPAVARSGMAIELRQNTRSVS